MNSRINLYRDEFKPQFIWLSATNAMALSVLTLLLMGGTYFGIWQSQQTRAQELTQIQSDIALKDRQLVELTKELTDRQKNPVLLAKLDTQKFRLSTAKDLADKLSNLSKFQEKPFSTALTSLAEVNNSSVWLKSFKISEANIEIQGNINEPAALPSWLKSIGKTSFFNSRDFRAASVFRTEGQLGFRIESKVGEKEETRGQINE